MSQTSRFAIAPAARTPRNEDSSSLTAILAMCAVGLAISLIMFAISPGWADTYDTSTLAGLY